MDNTLEMIRNMLNAKERVEIAISEIFKRHSYSKEEYANAITPLWGVSMYRGVKTQIITTESILKEILDTYMFIKECSTNGGMKIVSIKYSNKRLDTINSGIASMFLKCLELQADNYIQELNEAKNFNEKLRKASPYKDHIDYSDVLDFLNQNDISKEPSKFEEYTKIRIIYKILKQTSLIHRKLNQKNTTSLSNKECSLIYDIFVYLDGQRDNPEKTNKYKSDYIKYRIKASKKNKLSIIQ